jgi:glycosyltransferase involved in cell wall biosynthesis
LFGFSLFINSVIAFKALFPLLGLKRSQKAIFHCRTEIASHIMLKIRDRFYPNIKIVCDCRGVGSQEIIYKYAGSKGKILSEKILIAERSAYRNSDMLFCVSDSFKQYIRERNKDTPGIMVVPCCINTDSFRYDPEVRKDTRSRLGIDERFVVLYSGSFNEWQLPLKMIEIFNDFKHGIPESVFLVLTRDVHAAEEMLSASGIQKDSYIIRYVPFEDIPGFVSCGDISLLIREENDVNRVAFPIKFTEYVRCGVPVLTSITSDIGRLIAERDMGFTVRDPEDRKEVERTVKAVISDAGRIKSSKYKEKISDIISQEFSWKKFIPSIIKCYRDLYGKG